MFLRYHHGVTSRLACYNKGRVCTNQAKLIRTTLGLHNSRLNKQQTQLTFVGICHLVDVISCECINILFCFHLISTSVQLKYEQTHLFLTLEGFHVKGWKSSVYGCYKRNNDATMISYSIEGFWPKHILVVFSVFLQ